MTDAKPRNIPMLANKGFGPSYSHQEDAAENNYFTALSVPKIAFDYVMFNENGASLDGSPSEIDEL